MSHSSHLVWDHNLYLYHHYFPLTRSISYASESIHHQLTPMTLSNLSYSSSLTPLLRKGVMHAGSADRAPSRSSSLSITPITLIVITPPFLSQKPSLEGSFKRWTSIAGLKKGGWTRWGEIMELFHSFKQVRRGRGEGSGRFERVEWRGVMEG